MSGVLEYLLGLLVGARNSSWTWFASLSRDEWLVVLVVGCAAGLLCLRGFGSRGNY